MKMIYNSLEKRTINKIQIVKRLPEQPEVFKKSFSRINARYIRQCKTS